MGLLEDAANEYRLALRSKPGWIEPTNNLGIVLFKLGQHDKALSTFNRILHSDPFNAEARNNMGVVLADQGKTKEAVQNYRRAIEADPKYIRAVVNLERTLEDAGDFADAMVELEKLVKLTPDSADVRIRLAGLYLKMERYSEALEETRAALEWEPENIQALRIEGIVQRILGNDEAARVIFEHILSIDPLNLSFYLDLADIHFKRKEFKEAEERITAYLIRRPNDRKAKLLLGRLYAEMGSRTHAIQVFEELTKADPSDTEALAAAAELHKNAGAIEKALRTADKLVNVQGQRATSEDLSDLNKSLEFYESAVSAYSSSVREMWDRNIKLATDTGNEDDGKTGENINLLFGASGTTLAEEETEALFIEDLESFGDEIITEEDLVPEEEYVPLFDESENSLDRLAEFSEPMRPESRAHPNTPEPPQPQSELPPTPPKPQPQTPLPPQPQQPHAMPAPKPAPRQPAPPSMPEEHFIEEEETSFPGSPAETQPEDTPDDELILEDEGVEDLNAPEELPEEAQELPATDPEPQEPQNEMPKKEDTLALLEYLKSLAYSLPEKERTIFIRSNVQEKINFIKNTLQGAAPESTKRNHGEKNA
jgi:tetratricopeptide (TPR) repeat protein